MMDTRISEQYKIFTPPPKPNMQMRIGKDANMVFESYCYVKPNRFQRWMLRKFFAMYVEDIE